MKKLLLALGIVVGLFLCFVSIPLWVNTRCQILPHPVRTVAGLPWKTVPCRYSGFMWGPSAVEIAMGLKKSIDANGYWFLFR